MFVVALLASIRALLLANHGSTTFSDDAYYYLVTARNCNKIGFYTFDGMNATNGFHPLWMFLVRLMLIVVGGGASDRAQTMGLTLLDGLFYLIAIAISMSSFARLRNQERPERFVFLGFSLCMIYPFVAPIFFNGMETTMAACFLVLFFRGICDRNYRLVAVAAPLLFLSRLDTLPFIILPSALLLLVIEKDRSRVLLAGLPLVGTAATYMVLNQLSFGHPLPISGMLKSSFPNINFNPTHFLDAINLAAGEKGGLFRLIAMPVNLAMLMVCAGAGLWLSRKKGSANFSFYLPLICGALLILNLVLFQKWNKQIEAWYLVLPAILCLGGFLGGIFSKLRLSFQAPFAAAWVVIAGLAWTFSDLQEGVFHPSADRSQFGLASRLWYDDQNLTKLCIPKGAVLAGTDVGTASFRSHRQIVNLDGLINSFEYQDAIRCHELKSFLKRNHVRYLIVTVWPHVPTWQGRTNDLMYASRVNPAAVKGGKYVIDYKTYSYLYNCYSESLCLTPDMELARFAWKDESLDARDILFDIGKLLK